MKHTYSRICLQVVFSTYKRKPLIDPEWEEGLHKYITGILKGKGMVPIAVNGMENHLHILFFLAPTDRVSDLVREIKKAASQWIHTETTFEGPFQWQRGYGVFSYGVCNVETIANYVRKQKAIHARRQYEKEYIRFLEENEIDFEKKYLF